MIVDSSCVCSPRPSAMRAAAREYLKLANGFLTPHAPRLIAIGGESGCGKSTVASLAAPHLGEAPGALIIRSDVTRKHLFGCRLEDPLPPQAYSRQATDRTYGGILNAAKEGLAAGMTVIADAVYADPAERAALEHLARDAKVPFHGIWLDAPLKLRIERVGARRDDASDATADFLHKHPQRQKGMMRWSRIDASGNAGAVVAAVLESLEAAVAPA